VKCLIILEQLLEQLVEICTFNAQTMAKSLAL
jgi:hypothetical protein